MMQNPNAIVDLKKYHFEQLCKLQWTQNIIRVIKLRMMDGWGMWLRDRKEAHSVLKSGGKRHREDLNVDGTVI